MANDHGWMVTIYGIQTQLNIDQQEFESQDLQRA